MRKLLPSYILAVVFLLFTAFFQPAFAQTQTDQLYGGADLKTSTGDTLGLAQQDPRTTVSKIINVLFGFLGVVAVGLTMYGGYLWMTSGGNPEKIQHAKDVLRNAAIGLLIILSAWSLVMFILNAFFGNSSGGGGGGGAGPHGAGIGALGSGVIESVYPEPNQTGVARNTGIIVTFRVPMAVNTICDTASTTSCSGEEIASTTIRGIKVPNIRIYKTTEAPTCESESQITDQNCHWFKAKVYSTGDRKTFVFRPTEYLGSPIETVWHTVYMTDYLKRSNGDNAFRSYDGVRDQSWSFEVSNKLDLEPPMVKFGETFPAPDNAQDDSATVTSATQAHATIELRAKPAVSANASINSVTPFPTTATYPTANVTVGAACAESDLLVMVTNGATTLKRADADQTSLGNGKFSDDRKSVSFDACNLTLTLADNTFGTDGKYKDGTTQYAGNAWAVKLTPAQVGDVVTIGDTTFLAGDTESIEDHKFLSSLTLSQSAASLVNVVNGAGLGFTASSSAGSAVVSLISNAANADANKIALTTNNTAIFNLTAFAGGNSLENAVILKGRKDKPMNSVVQLNFNEAINPITLAGSSSVVSNYIQVRNANHTAKAAAVACVKDNECQSLMCVNGSCAGSYLAGKFMISNVYRTVEFISNNKCGVNACGEDIYCLPAESDIEVWLKTPDLDTCASDGDCASRSPYNKCDNKPTGNQPTGLTYKVCQNQASSTGVVNYPTALPNILSPQSGVMDAAFNALDGNRDLGANGSINDYSDNTIYGYCPVGGVHERLACTYDNHVDFCGLGSSCVGTDQDTASSVKKFGDNYVYSFWTSNQLKIGSPFIKNGLSPIYKDAGVSLVKDVEMNFSEVMMAASLTTGEREVQTAAGAVGDKHKLLNLGAFSGSAVGYWGKNEPQDTAPADGEIDWTKAIIGHTDFDTATKYWSQAGSGIRDIYQNCFKPSNGPGNVAGLCGVTDSSPSCCDGAASSSAACYKH